MFSVESPGNGINNAVGYRAVIFMPEIVRGNKIKISLKDRPDKKLYPLGGDTPEVGVYDSAGLYAQFLSDLKYCSEGASFAGNAVIRGDYL